MKTLCGSIVLASLGAARAVDPTPTSANHTAWQKFKVQHSKKYPTTEEDKRFIIFVGNLRRAEQLNNDEPHADFGVTKFSDMTTDEFRTRLGYRSSGAPSEVPMAPRVQVHGALPDSIDWTQRATTPVKDQGNCGSCWAFSATEQIESDFMVQKNVSVVLGVQEMVDCTASGLPRLGCLGGEPPAAYKVVQKLGGMELEKDYPYRGWMAIPTCHLKKPKLAVTVDDWAYVGKNDETEMKKYVGTSGPLSVCVNAGSWHSYRSGVMTNCPSRDTDHCVQVVGYGKTSDGLEYWKVRNSWGTNFGEEGFLRVALGSNQCAITSEPTKTSAGHVIGAPMPIEQRWEAWKAEYGKTYNDIDEEQTRFKTYQFSVMLIEATNAQPGLTYRLGENQFTDLTSEEFRATYTGFKRPEKPFGDAPYLGRHVANEDEVLADSVDWRTKGAVTAVKDQGTCGSCWAFSTIGSLEGAHQVKTGTLVSLSEQQLVSCARLKYGNLGCGGGQMDGGFKYAEANAMCTEDSYPYKGWLGQLAGCKASSCTTGIAKGGVTGYKDVKKDSEKDLMSAVQKGPVSVAVDATKFQSYRSGILSGDCGTNLDHGVLVVGYSTDATGGDYWIVKNSWNARWGEKGYIRVARGKGGKGECGILDQPSYPVVISSGIIV